MAYQALTGRKQSMIRAFLLILFLLFLYSFSLGILGTLNPHFQSLMHISPLESSFVEASFFIGYFIAPLPANFVMQKFGYKGGILAGLIIYASGALIFIPATHSLKYWIFLTALFVMAVGAAFIENGSDPYVTVLGDPQHSVRRITFAQSFGSFGQFVGPLIGGMFFYVAAQGANATEIAAVNARNTAGVEHVYIAVALIALITFGITLWLKMPDIRHEEKTARNQKHFRYLLSRRHFVWGVITQFFYLAGGIGIYAFFIDYTVRYWPGISTGAAVILFTASVGLVFLAHPIASLFFYYIKRVPQRAYLIFNTIMAVILLLPAIFFPGIPAIICLMASFFFFAIEYPVNFALATKDLGPHTKRASSLMLMAVSGGAVGPVIMGAVADYSLRWAFIIPAAFYTLNIVYSVWGYKVIPYKGTDDDSVIFDNAA